MTFVDPPSAPDAAGWGFSEYRLGYNAASEVTSGRMKVTFATGETGYDSGLFALDAGVVILSYSVYFSGPDAYTVQIPGGGRIPAGVARAPGWNAVRVSSRIVVNDVDIGPGYPGDIGCFLVGQSTVAYVHLDNFQVERSSSGNVITGIVQVDQGGTGVTTSTGSGSVVLNTAPIFRNVTVSGNIFGNVNVDNVVTANVFVGNGSGLFGLQIANTQGILPLVQGGTGVSTKTGTGNVVFDTSPILSNLTVLGTLAANVIGNGALLTNISADNVSTGILAIARGGTGASTSTGSGSLVLNTSPVFRGTVTMANVDAANISGNGSGLYSINLANAYGNLSTGATSGTGVVVLNVSPIFAGTVQMTGDLVANGAALSSIPAANVVGVLRNNVFPADITVSGAIEGAYLRGNGFGINNIVADNIASGVLNNARLPSTIAVSNIIANGFGISAVNAANLVGTLDASRLPNVVVANYFSGDGSGLTSIDASNVTTGTLPNARLPNTISVSTLQAATINATTVSGAFIGAFSGDGSALANINLANITSFTSIYQGNGTAAADAPAYSFIGNADSGMYYDIINEAVGVSAGGNTSILAFANGSVAIANVLSAAYIIGDGTYLTNVPPTTNASFLTEGTLANSVFPATLPLTGDLLATGNISGAYVFGNGAFLTNVPPATNASFLIEGTLANNIFPATLPLAGDLLATGNVTGAYLFGNGAFLTNVGPTINASFLSEGTLANAVFPSTLTIQNDVVANGNVTGTYVFGNGAFLTNAPPTTNASFLTQGTLANSVFPATLPLAGDLLATGNISGAYVFGNGAFLTNVGPTINASFLSEGTLANSVFPATLPLTGDLLATGNISGAYVFGNGAFLTNVGPTINASFLSEGTLANSVFPATLPLAGDLLATGNVTGAYVFGNGAFLTNVGPTINASFLSEGTLANAVFPSTLTIQNDVVANGNVTGAYILGNGAFLSNVPPTTNASFLSEGTLADAIFPPNLTLQNDVVANGNISGSYVLGNGAYLEGVIASSTVSNASALNEGVVPQKVLPITLGNALTSFLGNSVSTDTAFFETANANVFYGNVQGGTFAGNGVALETLNAGNLFGNCDLEFVFAPATIPAECIYGNLTPTIAANSLDSNTYLTGTLPQRIFPKTVGNANTVFIGQSCQITYVQSFGVQTQGLQARSAAFKTCRIENAYANATGTASAPAYAFDTRTDTGMYSPSTATIALAAGGLDVFRANAFATVLSNVSFSGITQFGALAENSQLVLGARGNVVHDVSKGTVWTHYGINSNFTPNFANVPVTENKIISATLLLNQGATAYMANLVQVNGGAVAVKWQGNAVPTPVANKVDCVTFSLIRSNYTWTVLGQNTSFG